MGKIFVEGLGSVDIEGDIPTPEEEAAIVGTIPEGKPDIETGKPDVEIEPVVGAPEEPEDLSGRTGLVPEAFVGEVREIVKGLPGLLEFAAEITPSTLGAIGGGAIGTPFGLTIPGAIAGGLLGEFIGQEAGVTPRSDVALGLAGAGPVVGKILGGTARVGRKLIGKSLVKLPPLASALSRMTAQRAVKEFQSVGGRILGHQKGLMARPAGDLYDAARKAGAHLPLIEFRPVYRAIQELTTEMRVFAAFPEGQQAMQLIDRSLDILAPKAGRVSFDSLIAARMMIGAAVDRAQHAGGIKLGTSKKVFRELSEMVDRVARGVTPARRGAKLVKTAAARAKLEFSVRDFETAVARFTKINPGEDAVTINISRLQNWLRNVTNPKDARFNKNFTDALKDELPELTKRLSELAKISGTGSAAGPGSLIVRGIGAQTGRTVIGGLIGFGVAGPFGAGLGGLAGASMPEMITGLFMTKAGAAALNKAAKLGSGEISAALWITIGEIVTRGPAFRPGEVPEQEMGETQ